MKSMHMGPLYLVYSSYTVVIVSKSFRTGRLEREL